MQSLYQTLTYNNTRHSLPRTAQKSNPIKVHLLRNDDIYLAYSTDPNIGLNEHAAKRNSVNGLNLLSPPKTYYITKLLGYVFGGLNTLMWLAAILSFISYEPLGSSSPAILSLGVGILLLIVIFISTFFYAYVDWNASKIMNSIKNLVANQAIVIRDEKVQQIDSANLVAGDVVLLSMGQRVPADIRLIEVSSDLKFDRSLLTGESELISGTVEPTDENPLETKNLALSSTFVVRGRAKGIVFQIGDETIIGQIMKMSGMQKTKITPIQKEINYFILIISTCAISFFVLAIIFWVAFLRHRYPTYETASVAVINAIGCLTAFVPIGLPICFALALTIVAQRMAARKVLVKNLSTIETLGCMSILCSDKTGTLTMGKMFVYSASFLDITVLATEIGSEDQIENSRLFGLQQLHTIASVCNDASFFPGGEYMPISDRQVNGDSTDAAILRYSEQYRSMFPALTGYTVLFTLAFNSKNKFMAKIVRNGTEPPKLLIKGGPDILMPSCSTVYSSNGQKSEITPDNYSRILSIQEGFSSQGYRVLALCQKTLDHENLPLGNQDALEKIIVDGVKNLELVGMLSICDPPRYDALPTVRAMRTAGVRVFMVTGDFELTAFACAHQVGIVTTEKAVRISELAELKKSHPLPVGLDIHDMKPNDETPVRSILINGNELEKVTEKDWDYIATNFSEMVFARTSPEQKLLIVENLSKRGDNVVAVTGDGTNDAPALKAADIGVAMGSGTDVAKEAAEMILLNNDFSSLLIGIENGRLVFDNLKKVLMYLMPAGSYGEFMAVLSNAFFGMQLPMSSFLQIVCCVFNDIFMSISIMYEHAESNLMTQKPRNARTDRLTDWRFFLQVYFFIGAGVWISAMGMWFLYMSDQGIHFYDLLLVYDKWQGGWIGYTEAQLLEFVNTGQCIYYVTMVICQIVTLMAVRNRHVSILDSNPLYGSRQNLVIFISIATTIITAIITLYGYWIQYVFGTSPIPVKFWFMPFGCAMGILLMDECRKAVVRAYPKSFVAWLAW